MLCQSPWSLPDALLGVAISAHSFTRRWQQARARASQTDASNMLGGYAYMLTLASTLLAPGVDNTLGGCASHTANLSSPLCCLLHLKKHTVDHVDSSPYRWFLLTRYRWLYTASTPARGLGLLSSTRQRHQPLRLQQPNARGLDDDIAPNDQWNSKLLTPSSRWFSHYETPPPWWLCRCINLILCSATWHERLRLQGKIRVSTQLYDSTRHSGATDEGMTLRVLTFSIPAIGQIRSPLEEYMKPARPNTSTWSRRQKLFINPNWLHI
jgi:hypothetical protein